jgi:hypothetical protein
MNRGVLSSFHAERAGAELFCQGVGKRADYEPPFVVMFFRLEIGLEGGAEQGCLRI